MAECDVYFFFRRNVSEKVNCYFPIVKYTLRKYMSMYVCMLGRRWRRCLRHCLTSRKMEVSIIGCVIVVFNFHNPSGHTMAMGSTQTLTEMSIRNISVWGGEIKATGARLTILPPSCADCLELWEHQPSGTLTACLGLYGDCFVFIFSRTYVCMYLIVFYLRNHKSKRKLQDYKGV